MCVSRLGIKDTVNKAVDKVFSFELNYRNNKNKCSWLWIPHVKINLYTEIVVSLMKTANQTGIIDLFSPSCEFLKISLQ